MRSVQAERYSRNLEQHDLSMQIRGLNGKMLTTKVVDHIESFNLDIWKAQFGPRS
jgi:hypothetical protein